MSTARALDLSVGAGVVLDDVEWVVERREPHLRAGPVGETGRFTAAPDVPVPGQSPALPSLLPDIGRGSGPWPAARIGGRLETGQAPAGRAAHGSPAGSEDGVPQRRSAEAGAGEPKPEYDPETTTLTERRLAKVAGLKALNREEAKLLGLAEVGYRTLIRWEKNRSRFGLIGCADDRWLRESGGHPSISEEVREAIFAVRAETLHRSRVDGRTREAMIHQYVRETFGPDTAVPGYHTLLRVWKEWFGPSRGTPAL